ncbi:nitrilase-related carbon-nitrogen hydrolase [Thermus thermamylovorans]|uniref:Carbon-nitrogen hydrolase family protein n=1 Tax=Thermus thermamylovorans TaxID=2509362 RepID=A0A4Q9B438_9DEIN|nr:nitrilase-related carbon-nitrogen hydrolase [Thermus thermamylovorans]TBH20086.1 carbon-nitrogen hydrolase family protein [Thermus thermamylovorans]
MPFRTLLALQAEVRPEHYRSGKAFRERVFALLEPLAGTPPPRLAALPELFGLPLLLHLEGEFHPRELLRDPLSPWRRARQAYGVFREAMAEAARAFGTYLLAGTLLSPPYEEELARGRFARTPLFQNLALFFNPEGRLLAQVPKMELTPPERWLRRGSFGPHLVETRAGKVGILICLDGFFERHLDRVDAWGAQILLQPSANPAPWDRPWPWDPSRKEGEVWLASARERLLGRENLRLLLNPMLNGRILGLAFEGRSGIYGPGEALLLARAPLGDEALLYAPPWA